MKSHKMGNIFTACRNSWNLISPFLNKSKIWKNIYYFLNIMEYKNIKKYQKYKHIRCQAQQNFI